MTARTRRTDTAGAEAAIFFTPNSPLRVSFTASAGIPRFRQRAARAVAAAKARAQHAAQQRPRAQWHVKRDVRQRTSRLVLSQRASDALGAKRARQTEAATRGRCDDGAKGL